MKRHTVFFTTVPLLAGVVIWLGITEAAQAAGRMKLDRLRCEYKTNPVGIDEPQPRLSWVVQPASRTQRGLKQSAYQIIVASSPALLKTGKGDLWDTSKVTSDQSVNLEYSGKPLAAEQDCYHYWLGCVGEWLQCSIAGLDTDGPGFGHITLGLCCAFFLEWPGAGAPVPGRFEVPVLVLHYFPTNGASIDIKVTGWKTRG